MRAREQTDQGGSVEQNRTGNGAAFLLAVTPCLYSRRDQSITSLQSYKKFFENSNTLRPENSNFWISD